MEEYTRFTGPDGASTDLDRSSIVILPVPYDRTSTWIKGADKGPFALLEASPELELYDIETDHEVYTRGIYTSAPLEVGQMEPERMCRVVENEVSSLLDGGKFVVTLGGEHSVSIGAVRAHASKEEPLSVLSLDAHADLRDEYHSSRFNHACVGARIKELAHLVEVGVRSMSREEKGVLPEGDIFFARDIASSGTWIDEVLSRLSDKVYVTIDLDVFDPALMPSTGTPQPGGLDWYQVTALLAAVSAQKSVTGFDIVELCPSGNNRAPDFLAAKLVYKFLSYVYKRKR
ncbi:MAG: agmatinase [Candidatus Omnitrophica bacterium]|nr:agmatinase [Candidatus Omnitrophota bacterium]